MASPSLAQRIFFPPRDLETASPSGRAVSASFPSLPDLSRPHLVRSPRALIAGGSAQSIDTAPSRLLLASAAAGCVGLCAWAEPASATEFEHAAGVLVRPLSSRGGVSTISSFFIPLVNKDPWIISVPLGLYGSAFARARHAAVPRSARNRRALDREGRGRDAYPPPDIAPYSILHRYIPSYPPGEGRPSHRVPPPPRPARRCPSPAVLTRPEAPPNPHFWLMKT